MRALHLISNYKFTGPVDPALLLAEGLRAAGAAEVLVAIGRAPARDADRSAAAVARARDLPVVDALALSKHRRPLLDRLDARRLARVAREFRPDIIHTHLGNDFRLAVRAGLAPVVHSLYGAAIAEVGDDLRAAIAARAAGVVVHSARLLGEVAALGAKARLVPPALDTARFDPRRRLEPAKHIALPDHRIAVGVVARIQRHRQFDLLLAAFRGALREDPGLLLVIVGRGTHAGEVAHEPVKRLGLEGRVVFTGYLSGDDYVALLGRLSILVFLVPGTDGTCRAMREAMALGVPVVGSRRGMIPELVDGGAAGVLVDETPEDLSRALLALARDDALRARLGRAAGARAASWAKERVALAVAEFYREIASSSG